jgi:hypothetical protein
MLSQLGAHRPLHQPPRQPGEKPTRPDDLLLAAGTRKQLVNHLVRKTITHLTRHLDQRLTVG